MTIFHRCKGKINQAQGILQSAISVDHKRKQISAKPHRKGRARELSRMRARLVIRRSRDRGSGPAPFVEIDHEIFSTVILSLPLIQEGKLSVTCEGMCTEYWLTAL